MRGSPRFPLVVVKDRKGDWTPRLPSQREFEQAIMGPYRTEYMLDGT
jgi:hypothetical protein